MFPSNRIHDHLPNSVLLVIVKLGVVQPWHEALDLLRQLRQELDLLFLRCQGTIWIWFRWTLALLQVRGLSTLIHPRVPFAIFAVFAFFAVFAVFAFAFPFPSSTSFFQDLQYIVLSEAADEESLNPPPNLETQKREKALSN